MLLSIFLMLSNISVTAFAEGTDSAPADEVTITEDETAAANEENGSVANEENGSAANEENGSSVNEENDSAANEKSGSSDSEKNGSTDIVVPDDEASGEAPQEPAASDRLETAGNRNAADNSEITTWGELQAALNAGGTVTLTKNITASYSDTALTVPSGVTVTLDLNNFVIDRDLLDKEPRPAGYVLKNEGTLTIKDSSSEKLGAITGGNTEDDEFSPGSFAGGVYNKGTLTLEEGGISFNHAADCAGVYNEGTILHDRRRNFVQSIRKGGRGRRTLWYLSLLRRQDHGQYVNK